MRLVHNAGRESHPMQWGRRDLRLRNGHLGRFAFAACTIGLISILLCVSVHAAGLAASVWAGLLVSLIASAGIARESEAGSSASPIEP